MINYFNTQRQNITNLQRFLIVSVLFLVQSLPFIINGELEFFGTLMSVILIPLFYPLVYIFVFIFSFIYLYGFKFNFKDLHSSSNYGTLYIIDLMIICFVIMIILGYFGVIEMTAY